MSKILKVGFSTNDEVNVGEHFGHCSKFVVFSIENGVIINREVLIAPEHAPGVFPQFISSNNIDVIITGGMGQRAFDLIKENGKQIILGASGNIAGILKLYLDGNLCSKGSTCAHHHHHHEDEHKCEH